MPRCAAVNFLPLRRLLGPGGCGTTDELANPGNGLFGARKDVEPFGGLSVEGAPLFPGHDGRRPSLLLAVVEETGTRGGNLCEVEVFALVEKLEVDEITRALTSLAQDGVEFLCVLVVGAHDWN